MTTALRFPIRFTGPSRGLAGLGITRANSYVELDEEELRVRMAWAFRARVPRSSIVTASDDRAPVRGWGAHGWRGEWLVNGSTSGIVRIEIDPAAPASTLGIRIRLRVLRVSVEDPVGLQEALRHP